MPQTEVIAKYTPTEYRFLRNELEIHAGMLSITRAQIKGRQAEDVKNRKDLLARESGIREFLKDM